MTLLSICKMELRFRDYRLLIWHGEVEIQEQDYRKESPTQRKIRHSSLILRNTPTNTQVRFNLRNEGFGLKVSGV